MKIADLERVLSSGKFARGGNVLRNDHPNAPERKGYVIFTAHNEYHISAREESDTDERRGGYLGCISQCRASLAGETWKRGNDLADGPLNEATLTRILMDIISCEMEHLAPSAWPNAIEARPAPEYASPIPCEIIPDTGNATPLN